jgi:hypothetical protein
LTIVTSGPKIKGVILIGKEKIDSATCREDLIRKAAESTFRPDFDWINDSEASRVSDDPSNRGFTAIEIRDLAQDFVRDGGNVICTPEKRESYRERRHFHYDIIVNCAPDDFPYGLYVDMELCNPDEDEPAVNLLNAHPQRGF